MPNSIKVSLSLYMCVSIVLIVQLALLVVPLEGTPTGAPQTACSTLIPIHHATPVSCGQRCPYKLSIVGSTSSRDFTYRCGEQYTLQLQSSGPPFKGLAVQSRTSTAQFDGNASFVGSFLNGGLDWKLWNCDSPSATHSSGSLKTSVNLIWKAPDIGRGQGLTIWYSIVANYSTYYVHLKGPELVPDIQSCSAGPVVSAVCNSSLKGQILTTACNPSLSVINASCAMDGELPKPCKLPYVRDISRLSKGVHYIRIVVNDQVGSRVESIQFTVNEAADSLVCSGGVRNNVLNVSCDYSHPITGTLCSIDSKPLYPCKLPFTRILTGLPFGAHTLTVLATAADGTNTSTTTRFNTSALPFSCTALVASAVLNVTCTSDSPIVAAKCSLDQETPKLCTVPFVEDISFLAAGLHQISISATTRGGTTLTTTETFIAESVLRLNCLAAVQDSTLKMNCNSSSPIKSAICLLDGKAAHACTLPYTRSVSALSAGIHTISISANGANGVNGSFTANFSIQAHLGLKCNTAASSSFVIVDCIQYSPLSLVMCALDGDEKRPCTLPYMRDTTSLAIGAHTVVVTATGLDGATVIVTERFVRPDFLNCTGALNLSTLIILCNSSKPLNNSWCTIDGKDTHSCALPYIRSVSSLSTGPHNIFISATTLNGANVSDSVNFTVQARLTLNCDRALNGSILLINCTPSSPLAAITCSLDGGVQRTCRLPLTLNVSLMAPGEHTVYLTATGVNGATAVSGITFLTNAVSVASCHSDVSNSVLTVTCDSGTPRNNIVCTIDGKGPHSCMLPYTRKVTSLSVGRHTWSLQAIGSTGVNLTLTTEFFIKGWQRDVLVAMGSYFNTSARVWGKLIARLNLGCSYVMVGGSTLIVSCLPSDPLASSACSIDSEVPQPCTLPYKRDVSSLSPRAHTVTISAVGVNGIDSTSILSFDQGATIRLNCINVDYVSIDNRLVVNCSTSVALVSATCAIDGETPQSCTFPYIRDIAQWPAGIHVVAISVIGANRASSSVLVDFRVDGLVANCSGAVTGSLLHANCKANYPIIRTTCSIDMEEPKSCPLPITWNVGNLSAGMHSLNVTVHSMNKAITVPVSFLVNS